MLRYARCAAWGYDGGMRAVVLATCVCAAMAMASAMERTLDARAIADAIAIGQSTSVRERERINEAYRVQVARPPVDYIDVVTPFRRIVLAAHARAARADRTFGQREALAVLAAAPDRVDVYVELTFHPLNTYVGVPNYRVALTPLRAPALTPPIDPISITRVPRFGPRLDGTPVPVPAPAYPILPNGSEPLLGGTVIAQFDASLLAPNDSYVLILIDGDQQIARAVLDLATMR